MKIKTIFAITLALSVSGLFAAEKEVVLPQSVLDLHTKACPEFVERETTDYKAYKEEFKLPKSQDSKVGPTLYIVGCEMYAYNSLEKAYIVDAYETKMVSVAEVIADGSIFATSDLMGAGFNPENNTLSTFSKGRGLGDCGQSATYTYNAEYSKFALTEARDKQECDGEYDAEWPVVYKK